MFKRIHKLTCSNTAVSVQNFLFPLWNAIMTTGIWSDWLVSEAQVKNVPLMSSSRAEPLPFGPLWAKPLNPEPADAGGGPGFHERRPEAHHQHTGWLTVRFAAADLTLVRLRQRLVKIKWFACFVTESFTGEAEEVEVGEDVGTLSYSVQSGSPGNGKNGP